MTQELDRALLRRRALGYSAAAPEIAPGSDLGRDLVLASGPNGADLQLVESLDALDQSLSIALTTGRGSDVFNTDFGFDGLNALAEESDPVMVRERVRVSIISLLQRERRVRRIVDVKFADDRLERPIPGSRDLDVRVAFEAITGDSATASLGRVTMDG
jgi:phage baseplate assembly protein W